MIIEESDRDMDRNKTIDLNVDESLNLTNRLVEIKKLQFNHIWSNKITQEDLNTPKQLDDDKDNMILMKNIFAGVARFAVKINEMFENVLFKNKVDLSGGNNNSEVYFNLLVFTNSLLQKLKNFFAIKTKYFKISREMMEPLIIMQNYYKLFHSNINANVIAKPLEEFYQKLTEFNSLLIVDN